MCVHACVRVRGRPCGKSNIIERIRRIRGEEEKVKSLCQFLTRTGLQNLLLVMNNAYEGPEPNRNL